LLRWNAVEINPNTFHTKRLIATVHKTLAGLRAVLNRSQPMRLWMRAESKTGAPASCFRIGEAHCRLVYQARPERIFIVDVAGV
jgi:hypothetical protein